MNPFEARTDANINHRAKNLFEQGYTVEAWGDNTDLFVMTTPAQKHYIVDTEKGTCTCPFFSKQDGETKTRMSCKHLRGITKLLADTQEAAILAQYEEEQNFEGIDGSNGGGWNW